MQPPRLSRKTGAVLLLSLFLLALYPWLAGGLFLIMIGQGDVTPGWFDIVDFWHGYSRHPVYAWRLWVAVLCLPIMLLVVVVAGLCRQWLKPPPLFGDARWATTEDMKKMGLLR